MAAAPAVVVVVVVVDDDDAAEEEESVVKQPRILELLAFLEGFFLGFFFFWGFSSWIGVELTSLMITIVSWTFSSSPTMPMVDTVVVVVVMLISVISMSLFGLLETLWWRLLLLLFAFLCFFVF